MATKINDKAKEYFARRHGTRRHPVVWETFVPGRGWRESQRRPATDPTFRTLRSQGVTAVGLTADRGETVADFTIRELLEVPGGWPN